MLSHIRARLVPLSCYVYASAPVLAAADASHSCHAVLTALVLFALLPLQIGQMLMFLHAKTSTRALPMVTQFLELMRNSRLMAARC